MRALPDQSSSMGWQRAPAVAGRFYPDDADTLERTVERLLDTAPTLHTARVRGLLVPHAEYACSGLVAATAFNTLRGQTHSLECVYLVGQAQNVPVRGAGLCSATAFVTPLGGVTVDQERVRILAAHSAYFHFSDDAHETEHCLEVQLPFLQRATRGRDLKIVPILLDDEAEIAAVSDAMWSLLREDVTAVVVATSNLSQYHPYAQAYAHDRSLISALVAGDDEAVRRAEASGVCAILLLTRLAQQAGWRPVRLAYLNSGDTCGPRDGVVGYAAIAYTEDDHVVA